MNIIVKMFRLHKELNKMKEANMQKLFYSQKICFDKGNF